jgi:hypothetical protein
VYALAVSQRHQARDRRFYVKETRQRCGFEALENRTGIKKGGKMTVQQTAKAWKCSQPRIYQWIKTKRIKYTVENGHIVIDPQAIRPVAQVRGQRLKGVEKALHRESN